MKEKLIRYLTFVVIIFLFIGLYLGLGIQNSAFKNKHNIFFTQHCDRPNYQTLP